MSPPSRYIFILTCANIENACLLHFRHIFLKIHVLEFFHAGIIQILNFSYFDLYAGKIQHLKNSSPHLCSEIIQILNFSNSKFSLCSDFSPGIIPNWIYSNSEFFQLFFNSCIIFIWQLLFMF